MKVLVLFFIFNEIDEILYCILIYYDIYFKENIDKSNFHILVFNCNFKKSNYCVLFLLPYKYLNLSQLIDLEL